MKVKGNTDSNNFRRDGVTKAFKGNVVSAQTAMSSIGRGKRVFIGSYCGEPQHLVPRLLTNQCHDYFVRIQEIASINFQFFKDYVTAGLVYLVLVSVIVPAARRLKKKLVLPGFQT